jgi:hypothetical protein
LGLSTPSAVALRAMRDIAYIGVGVLRARLKWAGGGGTNVHWQATRKVMMKRLAFLVTMIFAVPLLGLVGGCGKLDDQEPLSVS